MTLAGGVPFLRSPFVPAGDGEITVKSWGTDPDQTKRSGPPEPGASCTLCVSDLFFTACRLGLEAANVGLAGCVH